MRATSLHFVMATVLVLGAVGETWAQSTDFENPTPLTASTLKAELQDEVNRYYSFSAASGTVTVSVIVESTGGSAKVAAQVLQSNMTTLCAAEAHAVNGNIDAKSCSAKVDKPQRLVLRLGPTIYSPCKGCSYRIRIEGMSSGGAPASQPAPQAAASAPSAVPSPAQAGPGVRTMLIRLKDGTIMQIDLAKVADITYK